MKHFQLFLFTFCCLFSNCQSENRCDKLRAEFSTLIKNEFNFCETDSDCEVAWGICPLGCFFLINENKKEAMDEIRQKITANCSSCVYKCPIAPKKLRCLQGKCYPDIQDKSAFYFWGANCEKIVELYSPDIVGKKFDELDLHVLDYEIIYQYELSDFKKSENLVDNNLKFILDENKKIESIMCLERDRK